MDDTDRAIINTLQRGFPVTDSPYRGVAQRLGLNEADLIERLARLLDAKVLTRFGPLFQAERMGGAYTLAAMSVPDADFETVAALVNAHAEVAHNYRRDHRYNMWFVLATETEPEIEQAIARIERETGHQVLNLPKLREYFVGLELRA
ncbi:MAG: AsnC family transcriptional regulator [Burkholderiales bacterium]|nr:AsnC family transcriptional regulator [Burkholderiales bacterium]